MTEVGRESEGPLSDAKPWLLAAWRISPDAHLAVNTLTGEIMDFNPAAETLWGYAGPELVGKTYGDLWDSVTIAAFQSFTRASDREIFFLSCITILQHSGASRLVDMHVARPVDDPRYEHIRLCRFTDIAASDSEAELRRLNWALSAYTRSTAALIHATTFEELVGRVCEAIVEDGTYVVACVVLPHAGEPEPGASPDIANIIAGAGRAVGYLEGLRITAAEAEPEGQGPIGRALRSGVPDIMSDALTDPGYAFWRERAQRFGVRSLVSVPFRQGDEVAGVLAIYADRPDAFGPKELGLFGKLAEEIGFAMALYADREQLRATEAARLAAEERYSMTFNLAPIGLAQFSAEGDVVVVNETLCAMLGVARSDLLGWSIRDFTGMQAPGTSECPTVELARDAALAYIRRVADHDEPQRFDWRWRTPDGRTLWGEVHLRAAMVGGRTVVMGALTDITEQRALEQRLRQIQRMEAIGQLTGGLAHDFNNLLAIIQGNLELVAEDLGPDSEPAQLVRDALGAGRRGASLTHRLLAYSRQQPLSPVVIVPGELVSGLAGVFRRLIEETIRIDVKLPPDLWKVEIDQSQLENALMNLVVNARDAMPDGGVLTLSAENCTLDAEYAAAHHEVEAGDYVMLAVGDTGTGMTPAVAERALEPFFTTKPVGEGTGLGLAMVFGFVKQSGGHLKIYSEPGRGTSVKLYLPKAERAEGERQSDVASVAVPVSSGNEVVLLVEDDPDMRKLCVRFLSSLGYRIVEAGDGPTALAVLNGPEHVDVLLTDIVMPKEMTGPLLADHARRLRPGIKVLYMSGYASHTLVDRRDAQRAEPLLTKPFSKAALARRLRDVIDGGGHA